MDRIGRFEVVKELGRGAMGAVHLARDPLIDRAVAIKTIGLTGLNESERAAYRQRFFREAQAAGKLSHASIVTIYDVGEDETTHLPYIVMEFFAGRTLGDVLEEAAGPLPLGQALAWIKQVAQALSYAHARGITHRDVKPANIMITVEGEAKLTDFGIARLRNTQLTTAGDLLGTPAYMSPEQVEGKPSDGRSDIFSLGILLYWCLTGQKPFDGENPGEVMFKIAYKEPVNASTLRPELVAGFDAIIARALAKDPAQRYADAKDLAQDLEQVERGQPPQFAATMAAALPAAGASAVEPKAAERTQLVTAGDESVLRRAGGAPQRRAADVAGAMARVASAGKKLAGHAVAGAKHGARVVRGLPWARAGAAVAAAWGKFRSLPGKAKAGVIAALALGLLFLAWGPLFSPKATLAIRCHHDLAAGTLTILVDERDAMQAELTGATQRRFGVLRRTEGVYTGELRVPVGEHTIRVRVQSEGERVLASREVQGTFAKDETRSLAIRFDSRSGGLQVSLE